MERAGLARLAIALGAAATVGASAFAAGAAITSSDSGSAEDVVAGSTTTVAGATTSAAAGATTTSSLATATSRFEIEIVGFQFAPDDAVVAPGTLVVWTNLDSEPHSVISDGRLFPNSPTLETDDTYELVFDEPGTFRYLCGFHPSMTATITVEG